MIAHVIINPNRHLPNMTLEAELDRQRIDAKIWNCIPDSGSAMRSINLSHKQIVQFAKDHNLPEICIMEEDVMFPAKDGWQYFLANKPDNFDLYLAGAYTQDFETLAKVATSQKPVQINRFAGLHCYIIDQGFYDKFLAIPVEQHIDNIDGLGTYYACAPFAALQHPGWSANYKSTVDYNCDPNILENCTYYGKR